MTEFHLRRSSGDNNRSMVRFREKPTKVDRSGICVASESRVVVVIVNDQPPRVLGMIQPTFYSSNHFVKTAIFLDRTQPTCRRVIPQDPPSHSCEALFQRTLILAVQPKYCRI